MIQKSRTNRTTLARNKQLVAAHARATEMVERMLAIMEQVLEGPNPEAEKEWIRMFGTKQSMVVNLQKLVSMMQMLSKMEIDAAAHVASEEATLSDADAKIYDAWVDDREAMPTPLIEGEVN